MIFGGVRVGGPDWGGVSEGRSGNGREPDGTGSWDQECQMAGEGGNGRGLEGQMARWQLLGVVGQEGQMAGVVGQEADDREPDGAGAVGQGGPDG